MLHIISLIAGIVSLLIPSMVTLALGGYSSLDTKFPPIVCFASNRDITAYMLLIPMGVMTALIITELILIFRFLVRYSTFIYIERGRGREGGRREGATIILIKLAKINHDM